MQPATMIPEMALVSDISGVCKAGVTFQITIYIFIMYNLFYSNLKKV